MGFTTSGQEKPAAPTAARASPSPQPAASSTLRGHLKPRPSRKVLKRCFSESTSTAGTGLPGSPSASATPAAVGAAGSEA